MTIRQQGGVFGRNPTFNDANIDGDLTVSGSSNLNSADLSGNLDVTGASTMDGDVRMNGKLGLNVASPTYLLEMYDTTNNGEARFGSDNLTNGGTAASVLLAARNFGGAITDYAKVEALVRQRNVGVENGDLVFHTMRSGAMTEAARFGFSGNLAFPSGQGIDFSATSGTGTSELFDDYEEGTWTPEYTTSNGDYASISYVFQLGSYRKIGSLVFITLSMRTSAVNKTGATGLLQIKNLPFTAATQAQGAASMSVSYATIFNSIRPMGGYVVSGGTSIYPTYIANPVGSNWGELAAGELSTANPANILVLSGCYIAA